MNKAFTLLELLVVIGVIGLLAALSLPNFMSARQRARDAQRKSDLIQIQKALELYKLDHQNPVAYVDPLPEPGARWTHETDNTVVYMNKMPGDLNSPYFYQVDNGSLTYKLQACLENPADKDARDCEDSYSCGFSGNKCYIVEQP